MVAQGDVQYRPALGLIDLIAAKHGFNGFVQFTFAGELDQQRNGRIVYPVFGIVNQDVFK
ncbi:hypothetical protein D3C86_1824230 [compost metagenome]